MKKKRCYLKELDKECVSCVKMGNIVDNNDVSITVWRQSFLQNIAKNRSSPKVVVYVSNSWYLIFWKNVFLNWIPSQCTRYV